MQCLCIWRDFKALQVSKQLFIMLIPTKGKKENTCILLYNFIDIKEHCLHHKKFWWLVQFTILQTAIDSPYFGEGGSLFKTPLLCKNVINFFLRKWIFCKWNMLIVPCISFRNALFCGPHRLTFTWWGHCELCSWHKPAKLAHSFFSVLVSVSVCMTLSTVLHSINSPDNSPLSHSALSVLFLPYWSFQLDISLRKSPSVLI